MLWLFFLIKCFVRKSLIHHLPFWFWRWESETSTYPRLQSRVLQTRLARGKECLTLCFSLCSQDRDWEFLVKSNYNLSREMPLSSVDARNKRTPICLIWIHGFSWEKEEKVFKYRIVCVTCFTAGLQNLLADSRVSLLAMLPRISLFIFIV